MPHGREEVDKVSKEGSAEKEQQDKQWRRGEERRSRKYTLKRRGRGMRDDNKGAEM